LKARLVQRLRHVSQRDLLVVGFPVIALLAAGFWFAAQFIKPAPPDFLVMTTGSDGGAYQSFAARYKPLLQAYGIRLVEMPSAGSSDNLRHLLDPSQQVDVGFVQSGATAYRDDLPLVSLGSIYYEPLWVFYRGTPGLTRIDQLTGKRLAIGPKGSGTYELARELLDAHGMTSGSTTLVSDSGMQAVDALQRGAVDAVFLVGPPRSAAVWSLLYSKGIELMSLSQADAYTRRFPYLAKLTLPRGVIDFARDIPPRDITLVSPLASIVAREDTHPALLDIMLQIMMQVHREPDVLQRPGEFPSATQTDFPLSARAERFYKSGPPFLQRYLPFWLANFIDRIIVMLVPILALLFPLVRITPPLYSWRVRSRIYRWYGELKFLEYEAQHQPDSRTAEEWEAAVDRIEQAVNRTPAPLAFADHLYTLRMHIALVRRALARRVGAPPAR
jgi:TRAP transporter TAXI family solute receptor